MSNHKAHQTVYLKDYQAPAFAIDQVHLTFDLHPFYTDVTAHVQVKRNPDQAQPHLILQGEALELKEIWINQKELSANEYSEENNELTILNVPDEFELILLTRIKPHQNTELLGLYLSNKTYCTQCESHGFRRITYFLDRPDVMARYTTKIIADKQQYPVLLSNGNLIERGEVNGRRWVVWQDPFKKPCYLFALVAGDLTCVRDQFITQSGRTVALELYVEHGNESKCDHAMQSLKRAMKWDEQVYGREYDLDIYMIVAVSNFNAGAMENKGLNIFNDRYILARPDLATDDDYRAIETVVAHEYFHNWTGDRITCRDWFQLSLKEGLTVFREQEFSYDVYPYIISRLSDVQYLRTYQFAEDASPMAHPVQPQAYIEINNFYTATVYNKGAEVIRMLKTIVRAKGFRRGMDYYFEHYDGQAVTIEALVGSIEKANHINLQQFYLWYQQAGTPIVNVSSHYEPITRQYQLTFRQTIPDTPQQNNKQPMIIPIKIGLLTQQGQTIPLQIKANEDVIFSDETKTSLPHEVVLILRENQQTFSFENIDAVPVPSLLRDFSAPIKLKYDYTFEDLMVLMAYDSNSFTRWEASQILYMRHLLELKFLYLDNPKKFEDYYLNDGLKRAMQLTMEDAHIDLALKARMLTLPNLSYLCEQEEQIDLDALVAARMQLRKKIALELKFDFISLYEKTTKPHSYRFDAQGIAERELSSVLLYWVSFSDDVSGYDMALQHYQHANNMTDKLAALNALTHHDCFQRQQAFDDFYNQWREESLVVDKWFSLQARSELSDTLETVRSLMKHPAYIATNPNRIRALIGNFCQPNQFRFHDVRGEGYAFLTEQLIQLNAINPSVAARLITVWANWRKLDDVRKSLIEQQLRKILAVPALSPDVYEIVNKYLNAN